MWQDAGQHVAWHEVGTCTLWLLSKSWGSDGPVEILALPPTSQLTVGQ